MSTKVNHKAAAMLNKVSAALSTGDLATLNTQSVNDHMLATTIMAD